jgi:hypothetical protein
MSPELAEEIRGLVHEVEKAGQKQVEHLCRSLFTLMDEEPEIRFAIEPGQDIDDLLGLEAMGGGGFLGVAAEHADENHRGVEVVRHPHIVDGDNAAGFGVELAPEDFANRAFEEFADALLAERGHGG